jgi:hypothetical protein
VIHIALVPASRDREGAVPEQEQKAAVFALARDLGKSSVDAYLRLVASPTRRYRLAPIARPVELPHRPQPPAPPAAVQFIEGIVKKKRLALRWS